MLLFFLRFWIVYSKDSMGLCIPLFVCDLESCVSCHGLYSDSLSAPLSGEGFRTEHGSGRALDMSFAKYWVKELPFLHFEVVFNWFLCFGQVF